MGFVLWVEARDLRSLDSPHTPLPTRERRWQGGAYRPDLPAIFVPLKVWGRG